MKKKLIGRVFDLTVGEKFACCSNNFKEALNYFKDNFKSDWKEVESGKAKWERQVPTSPFGGSETEYATIVERTWYKEIPEVKSYYSNKSIRQKIDRRLKKIAALNAQRGTNQLSEEKINEKIAELLKEISNIDPRFLTNEDE